MIKLENAGTFPQAKCLLVIQGVGELSSVSLSTEEIKEEVGGTWLPSAASVRQFVSTFVDGKPLKLSAKVPVMQAVVCEVAFKVVVEIDVKSQLSSAYEKGDKSREMSVLTLVRVVEVWSSATKRLWAAADAGTGATKSPVTTMDSSGRLVKELAGAGRS